MMLNTRPGGLRCVINSPAVRLGKVVLAEFPVFDFVGGEGEFADGVFLAAEEFVLGTEGAVPESMETR